MERAHIFSSIILFLHLAYLGIFFGIVILDESYLRGLSTLVQFGVCLFLIYRFFPLRQVDVLTKFDRTVIFYCATFLLLNVVLIEVYKSFVTPLAPLFIPSHILSSRIATYDTRSLDKIDTQNFEPL